jgi:MORN repeat
MTLVGGYNMGYISNNRRSEA